MKKKLLIVILIILILLLISVSIVYFKYVFDGKSNLNVSNNLDDLSTLSTDSWGLNKIEVYESDGEVIEINDSGISLMIDINNLKICNIVSSNCDLVTYELNDNIIVIADGENLHFGGTYKITYEDEQLKLEKKLSDSEKILYYFTPLVG